MFLVNFEAMGENGDPVIVTRSEFMRRMKEMAAMNPGMGFYGAMGDQYTLVVNTDHKLVNEILENEKKEEKGNWNRLISRSRRPKRRKPNWTS